MTLEFRLFFPVWQNGKLPPPKISSRTIRSIRGVNRKQKELPSAFFSVWKLICPWTPPGLSSFDNNAAFLHFYFFLRSQKLPIQTRFDLRIYGRIKSFPRFGKASKRPIINNPVLFRPSAGFDFQACFGSKICFSPLVVYHYWYLSYLSASFLMIFYDMSNWENYDDYLGWPTPKR